MADIKGKDPLICTDSISLEDDTKPTRQMQHRLNSARKEVIKAMIYKLLDSGIIYPIADSKRVSPTQVAP